MKKTIQHKILAMALAIVGAVLLAFTYCPVTNPIQLRIDDGLVTMPMRRYIIGTLVSLLILSVAWYFNHKAQKLKRGEMDLEHEQKPSA
jgi:heme/copper-type cytochrome/quinol oxidase subunit 2